MTQDYSGAYLIGSIFIMLIWLVLFLRRRDLRTEMLTMSFLTLIWLSISGIYFVNYYITDYWKPEYHSLLRFGIFDKLGLKIGVEDGIFVFGAAGIAAVLYEEFLGKKHFRKSRKKNLKYLIIFPLIMFFTYLGVTLNGKINIIYADFIGYTLISLLVLYFRRDLIKHAIVSGLIAGVLCVILYLVFFLPTYPGIIEEWWILNKTSGIFLLGIPLEEILWAFFLGLWVGPSYEFLMGLRDN